MPVCYQYIRTDAKYRMFIKVRKFLKIFLHCKTSGTNFTLAPLLDICQSIFNDKNSLRSWAEEELLCEAIYQHNGCMPNECRGE